MPPSDTFIKYFYKDAVWPVAKKYLPEGCEIASVIKIYSGTEVSSINFSDKVNILKATSPILSSTSARGRIEYFLTISL